MIQHNRIFPSIRALVIAAAGVAATLVFSKPAAAAQPEGVVPSMTVAYSASELATDRAARALYRRIALAAVGVCPQYDPRDLEAFAASRACQHRAVSRALEQVRSPRLASLARRISRGG